MSMDLRQMLFIGEQRSKRAEVMGVHWEDGRLAAKQLFDALRACGIDPTKHRYVNIFGRKNCANIATVLRHSGPKIGMGKRVCLMLRAANIPHFPIVHPAARGAIRKKAVYAEHVRSVLADVRRHQDGLGIIN